MKHLAYEKPTIEVISMQYDDVVRTSLTSDEIVFEGYFNNGWI